MTVGRRRRGAAAPSARCSGQRAPDFLERLADATDLLPRVRLERQIELRRVERARHAEVLELLLRARDGETLFVEQALDQLDDLDVALAVEALLRARLGGRHPAELRLPIAQHVRLDAGDPADLADPVVPLAVASVGLRGRRALAPVASHRPPLSTRALRSC